MGSRGAAIAPDRSVASASVVFSALSHEGLRVETAAGKVAQLAVVDEQGNVIAAGDDVAAAAFEAAVKSYHAYLTGTGHIRVLSRPVTR